MMVMCKISKSACKKLPKSAFLARRQHLETEGSRKEIGASFSIGAKKRVLLSVTKVRKIRIGGRSREERRDCKKFF